MDIRKVVLMQDNTSTILLENNGHASSTKRTKHIDIRYFYMKEKVDSKDVIVEYCPIEHMQADFLPNPYTAICSNSYDLRSWVLIQAVHTTQITGVCCRMSSPRMRNNPTPLSMTEM